MFYKKAKYPFTTEKLAIEVPGSPDAPDLWLKEHRDNNFTIQWSEPRIYSNMSVAGYQIHLNDERVGAKLDKDVLKATLPLKPNRTYKINVQALSSKSIYRDSKFSNSLNVTTSMPMDGSQFVNPNASALAGEHSVQALGVSGNGDFSTSTGAGNDYSILNQSQVVALRLYYEQENESSFNDPNEVLIPLRISKLTEDYADLDWSRYNRIDPTINEFKIQWHCLNTNEHHEHRCGPMVNSYRLKRLRSGFTYRIKVSFSSMVNILILFNPAQNSTEIFFN